MTEAQIAVLSGILLLAAVSLFVFLGFLWGQRRTRQSGVYVNRDPQQDHDIEISSSRFSEAESETTRSEAESEMTRSEAEVETTRSEAEVETARVDQPLTAPTRDGGTAAPTALPTPTNPIGATSTPPMSTASTTLETMSSTDLKVKSKLYHYISHVTDVYDGDTITVDIDMGMGIWQRDVRIRLWRVNTSEVRGEEREQGLATRDFVRGLILDRDILLRTILDKRGQDRTGKYGRLLGEVLVEEDESGRMINLNNLLLEKGLATPVAADGSIVAPAAVPLPHDLESVGAQAITGVFCLYCGELRSVDQATGIVAICPNCFDDEYTLTSNVD